MDITFSAANAIGLNNPGTEIITLVKDGSGNFINPPSYDKMLVYLRSGEVPMLFVTTEGGDTGSLYQLADYSETENKIRFSNDANAIEFGAGANAPVVSDVVPKPLTYDYMPEGYPKKSAETVTVMAEQELAFAPIGVKGQYGAQLTKALDIVDGQTYTVKWDGTEYECVCSVYQSSLVFGNLSIMDMGNDTGEPFLYADTAFATTDTSASHTISVKRIEETATPMAEEFLPAAALITYDSGAHTYSTGLTYDELYSRLLGGKQVVLHKTFDNQYLYLTKWAKHPSGTIDLAFAGEDYSATLNTDGTIVKKQIG